MERHRVLVRAWLQGQVIGSASFSRYGVPDEPLSYPTVWSSSKTDVRKEWRRRGVAQAMYGHLKGYGYQIAPAPVLFPDGFMLWSRGLDPHIERPRGGDNKAVRNPPLSLPLHKDAIDPRTLIDRFDTEKPMRELWCQRDTRRQVVTLLTDERIARLRTALELMFSDPDHALGELLKSTDETDRLWRRLARHPEEFGVLKEPRPTGFARLFSSWKKISPDILNLIEPAREALDEILTDDEMKHRCAYEEDCVTWIGRAVDVRTEYVRDS